jgi:hypothetical protein
MRFLYFLFPILILSACGGRSINNRNARGIIVSIPQETLEKEDVDVVKVSQTSGSEAIVETRLKTAFRLERVRGGEWEVREVRLGHGQWEKVENLERTLEMVRIEETQKLLDQVAASVQAYKKANGALPKFSDYISLSDILSPKYMTPLIRLDAWRRPLGAERQRNAVIIWSVGPDGQPGTDDDIRKPIE